MSDPGSDQVVVKGTHITFIVGDTTLLDENLDKYSSLLGMPPLRGGIIGFAANDAAIFTIYSISVDVV